MTKIHLIADAGSFKAGWVVSVSDSLANEWIKDGKAEVAHGKAPEHKFAPGKYQEWLTGFKSQKPAKKKGDEKV